MLVQSFLCVSLIATVVCSLEEEQLAGRPVASVPSQAHEMVEGVKPAWRVRLESMIDSSCVFSENRSDIKSVQDMLKEADADFQKVRAAIENCIKVSEGTLKSFLVEALSCIDADEAKA